MAPLALRILVAVLVSWASLAAAQPRVSADAVKAAFLYNFTAFVEWPAPLSRDQALTITVAGAPEVASDLRGQLATKTPHRRLSVAEAATPDELARADVLYVGARESRRLERWIAAVAGRAVLIVSDDPQGLERGSMINFITTDRVQFEVSVPAAQAAGLRLSSRLLSVAVRIKKGELEPWVEYASIDGRATARRRDRLSEKPASTPATDDAENARTSSSGGGSDVQVPQELDNRFVIHRVAPGSYRAEQEAIGAGALERGINVPGIARTLGRAEAPQRAMDLRDEFVFHSPSEQPPCRGYVPCWHKG